MADVLYGELLKLDRSIKVALELIDCQEYLDFILKPYNFGQFFEILTIVACIRVARFCTAGYCALFDFVQ